MDDAELERALRDVGERLAYPRAIGLATRVRATIAERPTPRRSWLTLLAPAVLTLVVLGAGAAAAEVIALRGIEVLRGPVASQAPAASPRLPNAARVASLDEAARRAGFRALVPASLGTPEEIDVAQVAGGSPQIALLYGARADIPASRFAGVGVLVTEARATLEPPLLAKFVGPNSKVEQLTVNGGRAIWIVGAPHEVFYRDGNGNVVMDTLRLAGNVLLWEQGGLLVRLEAELPRDRVLAIAASVR